MKEDELPVLAQFLTSFKESVEKLEIALERRNADDVLKIKNELKNIQERIDKLL
jgi:hypothetical protein